MLFKFIQCIVFGVLSSQLAIHHLRFLGVFFFLFTVHVQNIEGLPVGSVSKDSSCNIGDTGSIPGLGRSPREGNSNPLQYSHLGNPMDRRAWRATVHGVAKSWTWLSDYTATTRGWESACQSQGHGFNSWSRKTLHATGQLSPGTTTTEPTRSRVWESQEKLPQRRAAASRCNRDKSTQQWRPSTAKSEQKQKHFK